MLSIKGKVLEVFPVVQVSEKFRKREFVVEYVENPQYPEFIKFECVQDKCELLDRVAPGQQVEVSFNLRGRSYVNPQGQKSYFNSLQAWRILPAADSGYTPSGQQAPQQHSPAPESAPDMGAYSGGDDDLPF
jgi:single-stranded DNA-binding protein